MALDQLYQRIILEHNRAPRRRGRLDAATHQARGRDALCGDDILVELRVEAGCIEDAAFSGEACAITTASASMLMDWLVGRSLDDFRVAHERFASCLADARMPDAPELGDINCLRAVSAFPARVRNALLPWQTVGRAVDGDD
jgi:nitrogen fixation NifU-like protein